MTPLRLAITMLLVPLALGVAAGSAVGATSRLVPSAPWLTPAAPALPARPHSATRPAKPSARPKALPNTGFEIWPELLIGGILVCSGSAIRARIRRGGIVRLAPVLAGRR